MANFNFNKVIIAGRLTADPEQRQTASGVSVVSFSVAVKRRGKDNDTDFFTVTAWREEAEFVARYFKKGSSLCIVGKLQNAAWIDKDGKKCYRTDIIAEEISFVDSKAEREQNTYDESMPVPQFKEMDKDDDLPF